MRRRRDDERGGGDQGDERVCGWYNKGSVWSRLDVFPVQPPHPTLVTQRTSLYAAPLTLSLDVFCSQKHGWAVIGCHPERGREEKAT
jgi:hypothetical protein